MTWLVLDTSGPWCAALLRRSRPQGGWADVQRRADIGRGHDQALAPMVADLLQEAALAPDDIAQLAVCVGPGSFAGVRVGVAFARGFARARGIEVVGVSALDAWALAAAGDRGGFSAGVHDARRGEVVWRAFRAGAPLDAPATQSVADARAALLAVSGGAEVRLAGGGAALLAGGALIDTGLRAVDLAVMAEWAAAHPAPARPFYHRPPDAAPPRAARPVGAGPQARR